MNPIYQDILVVDDHPDLRMSLSSLLESAGYRVRTAADGNEALQAVRLECPYFVLTDWCMHPMDGIEFCRRLRQENWGHYVYLMLLTVKNEADDIITGLNAGADDFMSKPVRRAELLARLEAGARVLALEERLNQLARSDPLTGVLNCRTAYQLLEKEWCRAIRYQHPLSCVIWDVDHFKLINDTYGHLVGDEVLRALAQVTESKCRSPDYVCRWGGDEFLVILPETNEQGATCWAERCCAAIAETAYSFRGYTLSVTASFGVAGRQESMQNAEQMLDTADQALYCAKKTGRRRVMSYGAMTTERLVSLESSSTCETDVEESCVTSP